MLNWLAVGLVLMGTVILGRALKPVWNLIDQVPQGTLRHRWRFMSILIALFIVGYLVYGVVVFRFEHITWHDLVVPVVFFFGTTFVWLSTSNAQQTVTDIRRVALLEQQTITDPLIGIYNRRYLDRRMEEEFSRSRRYGTPLAVLMLDIDHFKSINDTYGHQAGDLVLIHLGKLLLSSIRKADIVARYGGEELVIITPNSSLGGAVELAERIRRYIEPPPDRRGRASTRDQSHGQHRDRRHHPLVRGRRRAALQGR